MERDGTDKINEMPPRGNKRIVGSRALPQLLRYNFALINARAPRFYEKLQRRKPYHHHLS